MHRKRILVIDDDPDILQVVQLVLEEEGYLTNTSLEARKIESLLSSHPDLILLDVLLADADGRLMSKRLKSQKSTKHIPIVLMSAHGSAVSTLATSGADAFIAKPFDIETLLATIEKYV